MEEDTIELVDFLRVIWKRKRLIIVGTLACMVTAGVLSFLLPQVYRVYSVVEIGTVVRGDEVVPIEDPNDTKTKIKKAYSFKVMEELKIPEHEFPGLEVDNPKGTRIIEISTEAKDINQALNVLEKANILILNDHKSLVAEAQTTLSNNIKTIVLKVNTLKSEKKALSQKLSLLKDNRKNIQEQIKNVEKRLEELLAEKKKLNLSANPNNTLSMLVFSSEIQENQRYYNKLQDKLKFDIAILEVDNRIELARKEEKLETWELKKQNLQTRLDNLKETTIIKKPNYLKIPVKPKKKLSVLIAGVVGLMMSLFLAFFIEYLEKVRKRGQ